jgi:endonuclease/exonuclease/phosphatase family metal-dependent hydrolase
MSQSTATKREMVADKRETVVGKRMSSPNKRKSASKNARQRRKKSKRRRTASPEQTDEKRLLFELFGWDSDTEQLPQEDETLCLICDRCFSNPNNRRAHERSIHGGQKSHCCDDCEKVYTYASGLSRHVRTSHPSAEKDEVELKSLTRAVMTWNIAECKVSEAKSAAEYWSGSETAIIAEVDSHSPDIICLQECPTERFPIRGYIQWCSRRTHCGFTTIYSRSDVNAWPLAASFPSITVDGVAYVSVHLAPSKRNATRRREQIHDLLEEIEGACVIVGDWNLRNSEVRSIEKMGLREEGQSVRVTWDSCENHFHGESAFQFACKFDRAFSRGWSGSSATRCGDQSYAPHAYISDHWGMVLKGTRD